MPFIIDSHFEAALDGQCRQRELCRPIDREAEEGEVARLVPLGVINEQGHEPGDEYHKPTI